MRSGGHYDDVEAWLSSVSSAVYQTHSGGHRPSHGSTSSRSSSQSLDKLIEALARLEKAVTAGNEGWPATQARQQAQQTYAVLSGMAHGAKLGVFGNTVGDIGAGVGGLLSAFGVQGADQYIDAIAGAGSIYQTGASQGVNVGNVISGAAQGAALGSAFGPAGTAIGAGVGGLLDIFGGLFGHHKPKVPETNTYDPGLYHSASDFDYYARLYNATGKYPNLPGQGFNAQANTVQIHFYSDGVAQAVQQQTGAATTRSAMTVASAWYDHTRPQ